MFIARCASLGERIESAHLFTFGFSSFMIGKQGNLFGINFLPQNGNRSDLVFRIIEMGDQGDTQP